MKKIGLICLALVLAMGALGVGYAQWSETLTITESVTTGTVCLEFAQSAGAYAEEQRPTPLTDLNYTTWVTRSGDPEMSCPPGYKFDEAGIHTETMDVGYLDPASIVISTDKKLLQMTIEHAYPYYVTEIRVLVNNCGSIPVTFKLPVITQHPSLRIWYLDSVGTTLHPGNSVAISFYVGVAPYEWDSAIPGDSAVLTTQDTGLGFTIAIEAVQWNEY